MSKTFFIADTHFNHERIISICERQFSDVEEMNKKLIENWNSIVEDEDTVWVLGDYFYFSEPLKSCVPLLVCREITHNLKGIKNLIIGNHDTQDPEYYKSSGFEFVSPYPVIYDNFFILSHEPLLLSSTTPYFNLYGHVHNDPRFEDTSTSKCVSVERINYTPVSLERIKFEIETWIF